MASELAAKTYYLHPLKFVAGLCLAAWATLGRAQSPPAVGVAAPPIAGQSVYEPGDVYLPYSRVYVFVGKTGLGHEHGVIGSIKQGRIDLSAARDAGGLLFDMTSFEADT